MKISACVVVYQDPDIMRAALRAIEPVVDQIVVVDGPYEWLLPFLPRRQRGGWQSDDATLGVIDEFSPTGKVKYLSGVWKNELAKREFAFDACDHDVVYLVDADEIHRLDDREVERFLSSGKGIAGLASPLLVTDAVVVGQSAETCDAMKPMIFRKDRISAAGHLGALWLVLPEAERNSLPEFPHEEVWQSPVGINYHLSLMRTLETSVQRARFYIFNWIRGENILPWLRGRPLESLDELRSIIDRWPPRTIERHLLGNDIALGFVHRQNDRYFPIVPPAEVAGIIGRQFRSFRASAQAASQIPPDSPRVLFNGQRFFIDVTDTLSPGGTSFTLTCDRADADWRLSIIECFLGPQPRREYQLATSKIGNEVVGRYRSEPGGELPAFRSMLCIQASWADHAVDYLLLCDFKQGEP